MEKVLQGFEDFVCGLITRKEFSETTAAAAAVAAADVVNAAVEAAFAARAEHIATSCKHLVQAWAANAATARAPIEVACASRAAQEARVDAQTRLTRANWVCNPAMLALYACFAGV